MVCIYPTDVSVLNQTEGATYAYSPWPPIENLHNAHADLVMEVPTIRTSAPSWDTLPAPSPMLASDYNWPTELGLTLSDSMGSSASDSPIHPHSNTRLPDTFQDIDPPTRGNCYDRLVGPPLDSMGSVIPTPESSSNHSQLSIEGSAVSMTAMRGLPPLERIMELCASFFDRHHFLLPCIHRQSFFEWLLSDSGLPARSPLLWAVLAVAAFSDPSTEVQTQCEPWMKEAIPIFNRNIASTPYPTEMLQAAVWLIYTYYVRGDLTSAWLMHVKACQMVAMLGLNKIDSARPRRRVTSAPWLQDRLKIEEQRKTVWCLFVLDRLFCTTTGFSLALDDRSFQVNFPIKDDVFQGARSSVYSNHLYMLSSSLTLKIERSPDRITRRFHHGHYCPSGLDSVTSTHVRHTLWSYHQSDCNIGENHCSSQSATRFSVCRLVRQRSHRIGVCIRLFTRSHRTKP